MKTTIKLVLVVSILSSTAFADGNMGTGGKTCTGTPCFVATQPTEKVPVEPETENSILTFVKNYLFSIFG